MTFELAQRVADTFHRTGRVFQAGTQRRNISNFIHAIELAKTGKLGSLPRFTRLLSTRSSISVGIARNSEVVPPGQYIIEYDGHVLFEILGGFAPRLVDASNYIDRGAEPGLR